MVEMQPIENFTGRMFGYARVSTDDQNIDMQVQAMIAAGVPEPLIFTEHKSGKSMDRPMFKKLLRAVRPGDCIVVWKLDRLGRSMIGVLETIEMFTREGIHFRVLRDNIDTTSPMGRFVMHLFAAIADLERSLISERTKAGVANYIAQGGKMGRGHYILEYPKRLKRWHELAVARELHGMSAVEIIAAMHKADKKAPLYKSDQSYKNWYQAGYPGLKKALEAADLSMPRNLPKPKKREKKGE